MSWLVTPIKRRNPRIQLFCFAHAGGGASTYTSWSKFSPEWIEISSIQYPGHETRILEPLSDNFNELVDSISESLISYVTAPFAFFGHSMGGLFAYEIARKIRSKNMNEPFVLFISGRNAPNSQSILPPISKYPEEAFIRELNNRYGKLPNEIIDEPEIRKIYLPILRNDLSLVETYSHAVSTPLSSPIFIYCGTKDSLTEREKMLGWHKLTTGKITERWFDGDHFYILDQKSKLLNNLFKDLTNSLSPNELK